MAWTAEDLKAVGFHGFIRVDELLEAEIPNVGGVYVVVCPRDMKPRFLDRSRITRAERGKDPNVPVEVLAASWVPASEVLYIGAVGKAEESANTLRTRLKLLHGRSRGRVGHWGGWYLEQLEGAGELLVAWMTTPGRDPKLERASLLREYFLEFETRPYANIAGPVGTRRAS